MAEKETLLTQGFGDWNKKDFNQFIKLCGEYGRDDIDSISQEVEGRLQSKFLSTNTFWDKKEELTDHVSYH